MKLRELSIVNIVEERTSILKKGKNYRLNCPFHDDKTPSMILYTDTNTFHCFGCHKSGNVVTFISDFDKITVKDTLIKLRDIYNVDDLSISEKPTYNDPNITNFHEFTKFCLFHSNNSYSKIALQYLSSRKITYETAQYFELGIVQKDNSSDSGFFNTFNFYPNYKDLLMLFKDSNGIINTFFSYRIIYPIYDTNREIRLFGGRSFTDKEPKYIYSNKIGDIGKSNFIYNLHNCTNKEPLYVCEGVFDVWALYQNGEKNSVAILGSSFSDDQIRLLENFDNTIFFCLDSDKPGKDGVRKLLEENILIRNKSFVIITPSNDPYDFYMKDKGDNINQYALESNRFLVHEFIEMLPIETQLDKRELMNVIFKIFIESEYTVVSYGIDKLSHSLNVDEKYLRAMFDEFVRIFNPQYDFIRHYENNIFYIKDGEKFYLIKAFDNGYSRKHHLYRMYFTPYSKEIFDDNKIMKLDFNSGENICIFNSDEAMNVYKMIVKWRVTDEV
jgi:DNA primase